VRLRLDAWVDGTDGELGVLADVVVDPESGRVTHLVVEPRRYAALARLVPIDRARPGDADGARLALACSADDLRHMPEVRELGYDGLRGFPIEDPDWEVGIADVLGLPGDGVPGLDVEPGAASAPALIYDRIPRGEVELRRGSPVVAADGRRVGRVAELVTDEDMGITAVVVGRGWFRRPRLLAIPVAAVARVDTDAVMLRVAPPEAGGRPR
jgi:sporulation protein YlmC with PRC-barrel domain